MHTVWLDLFHPGIPVLEKVVRTIVVYAFLLIGLRLAGKRELTQLNPFDLVVLLLPAFFAFTGLRTQIGLVSGLQEWILCGLIILVASAGKFGGSLLAARITGLGWREGSALGVLMNTRGLMELIVLNIGLEMRVISPTLFAMLVIMALVTTFATTPILHLITRHYPMEREAAAARRLLASSDEPDRSAILVPVADPQGVSVLVEMALVATPPEAPPPRVLALVRRPLGGVRSGLREADQRVAPRSPALSAALDHAWESGAVITPQAVWSDNPADDILRAAVDAQIGWILLGAHRAVFGSDFTGGVVQRILDGAPIRATVSDRAYPGKRRVSAMNYHTHVDGQPARALFSGDTIIDREHWGSQELVRAWCRLAGQLKSQRGDRPFYWFLISKGRRTYLYLPYFFREFYPRGDRPTPAFAQRLIRALGRLRYPEEFDPRTGLIEPAGPHDRLKPELDATLRRLRNPHVAFFTRRNPRYQEGVELACVAEISPQNMRSLARRELEAGMQAAGLARV